MRFGACSSGFEATDLQARRALDQPIGDVEA
jgi:hypothetical protein